MNELDEIWQQMILEAARKAAATGRCGRCRLSRAQSHQRRDSRGKLQLAFRILPGTLRRSEQTGHPA